MFVKARYAKHLPPSSLNSRLVQLGANFSLVVTFSFFFFWLQSFEGGSDSLGKGSDILDPTCKRCSSDFWSLHLLQIVQTQEMCSSAIQSIWEEHSTLTPWRDIEEGNFQNLFYHHVMQKTWEKGLRQLQSHKSYVSYPMIETYMIIYSVWPRCLGRVHVRGRRGRLGYLSLYANDVDICAVCKINCHTFLGALIMLANDKIGN